ncbi:MAG: OsmC family peroxiredoxin, partial [Acidimicrobiia bacterium]|nr:OsmC family peroxiredoxin [Acidimicrobiia bacterium]
DLQGILGMDRNVRNGFSCVRVRFEIDADADADAIRSLVAQSQKRSAVYDILTGKVPVEIDVVAK